MQFGDDERAAAIQVGAVLLFGILIISMAMYQATVVPDQNKGVEFNHNQKVQGQMQDLRNSVVSVPRGGGGGSVTVDLGTTYPSRSLFVNPGPPYGSLRTEGTNDANVNVSIENANATNEEVQDFWDGSTRAFETGAIVYRPDYHEYENPPETVYEHTLLYNQFRNANLSITDQSLVNGDEITLVALDGNLSENGMSAASVTADPVSASTNTVTVRNESAPINITVATRLDNETWSEAIRAEYGSNGGNVIGQYYESVPGEEHALLTIELEPNVRYDLRMAKVSVGSGASDPTDELYLTGVEGGGTVQAGDTQTVTVEVRDRYNNPVGNETVNFSADRGSVDASNATTDSDGQATVTYTAPSSDGDDTVTANISASPSESEEVEFMMDVQSSGGGGGSGAYSLQWDMSHIDTMTDMSCHASNDTCVYDLQDGNSATMTANTSEPTSQVFVDFANNDTTVAEFDSPSHDTTDSSGEAAKTLNLLDTGRALVSASAAEDGDAVIVKVINRSSYPIADAGGPYVVYENDTVTLDGSNSTDTKGIDYYDWVITNDSTNDATISDTDNTTPGATFEASENVSSNTDITVELTITDTDGNTDNNSATVTVYDTDSSDTTAPTIGSATISDETDADGNVTTGDTVLVEVTTSDGGAGVDRVMANTSDFGGPAPLELTDGNSDGTYNEAFTVESSSIASEGAQNVTITVTDGAGNTNTTTTNTLTVDTTDPVVSGFGTTNPSGMNVSVTFDSNESLKEIRVPITDSTGTTVTTLTASDFTESLSGGTFTYNATYTVTSEDNYTATLMRAEDVADNDGANGESDYVVIDNTSPTFMRLNATAIDDGSGGGSSGNDAEKVRFGYETRDNLTVDQIRLIVRDNNGAEVANVTRSVTNDTYTVTLSSSVSVNGNNDVTVEATAFDSTGNRRQCTGYIPDTGSANMIEKQSNDFTCLNA